MSSIGMALISDALDADPRAPQSDPHALSCDSHVLVGGALLGFGLLAPRNGTVLTVLS